jgi:hypothetical protein
MHGSLLGNRRGLFACLAGVLLFAGCVHPAPPMRSPNTAVISGRTTAGISQADAAQSVLAAAAQMTVDHGFRYFRLAGSPQAPATTSGSRNDIAAIQPGSDVLIHVYRESEIDPRAGGVWDAQGILTGAPAGHPPSQELTAAAPVARVNSPATSTNPVTVKCTIYGCAWPNPH